MKEFSNARKRILSLLDENSFAEMGASVRARSTDFAPDPEAQPSDGVITGYGLIDGRLVYVYAQDEEVLGGSVGEMHAQKIRSLYRMAVRTGAPVIGLIASAGFRLREGTDALNAFACLYEAAASASGIVPQITGIFGTCGGGLSILSGISDFTFMTDEARLFVNAPNAVAGNYEEKKNTASASAKAAAGAVDMTGTEEEVICAIRTLVAMLPGSNEEEACAECTDDLNRILAGAADKASDAAALAEMIADEGEAIELKKDHAPEMVTMFIRLAGMTVGVVGNRSTDTKGMIGKESLTDLLTTDGMRKAARFVHFCDAFGIPVLSLSSAAGFAASEDEENTVAAAAAQLVCAFADATVPKVNVITGSLMGSAYAVMNAKGTGADYTFALPGAKIGVMKASVAANILSKEQDAASLKEAEEAFDALQNSIDAAAGRGYVDQVVEPDKLRSYLIGIMEVLYSKASVQPSRKHSTHIG